MRNDHIGLAAAIVFATGALWGFYWLPVRQLADLGLHGAWGTFAITTAAALILSPVAMYRGGGTPRRDLAAVAAVALGGAAFALYSVGFVYGRVAIIILLYFLTPVWSTLIGHFALGWRTPPMRLWAIVAGLAGLAVMLGGDGNIPMPEGAGEWMSLIAGLLWSISTTGIRTRSRIAPVASAFIFAVGAAATALALTPFAAGSPHGPSGSNTVAILGAAFLAGALWWVLSITALMWATVRVDPARVGILLMTEVVVGAASAAVLAQETLSRVELIGGLLVPATGVLEIWPIKKAGQSASTGH